MKKLYLAAGTVILASLCADAASTTKIRFTPSARYEKTAVSKKKAAAKFFAPEKGAEVWRPGKTVLWVADEAGNWILDSEATAEYDAAGNYTHDTHKIYLEDDVVEYEVTTRQYNDNGYFTQEIVEFGPTADELELSSKWTREYDSKILWYEVRNERYTWNAGDWTRLGVNYIRDVERNAAGNIVRSTYKSWYMNDWEAVQRIDVEYGSDGNATAITEYQLAYDENFNEYWQEGTSVRDCKWVETNGQFTSPTAICGDGNLISTASLYDEGELLGTLSCTYSADGGFEMKTDDGESVMTQKWSPLPYNGYEMVIEYDDMGVPVKEYEREEYNVFDIQTLAITYVEFDGEYEIFGWIVSDTEYDAAGLPETVVTRSFEQVWEEEPLEAPVRKAEAFSDDFSNPPVEGEWKNSMKFEFSEIKDVAGVSLLAPADAPAEYYTIEGLRVAQPGHGLYIVRKGGKTSKVIF